MVLFSVIISFPFRNRKIARLHCTAQEIISGDIHFVAALVFTNTDFFNAGILINLLSFPFRH
jgi:hypothetical protein